MHIAQGLGVLLRRSVTGKSRNALASLATHTSKHGISVGDAVLRVGFQWTGATEHLPPSCRK